MSDYNSLEPLYLDNEGDGSVDQVDDLLAELNELVGYT